MNEAYDRFLRENRGILNFTFITIGAATMALSYQGVAPEIDPGGGMMAAAMPFIYAVGTGTFVFGHWHFASRVLPKLGAFKARLYGTIVMVLGAAGIVGLSSPLNLSALAGSEAINLHMQDSLMRYEQAVEEHYERGMQIETLAPVISINADRLERNAVEEARSGRVSNVAGKGAVSRTLKDSAAQVRGMLAPVNKAVLRVQERAKAARASLENARGIIASDTDAKGRMRQFAREMDSLRAIFVEMDVSATARSVERLGLSLPESIVGRTGSTNAQIAAAQEKSIAFVLKNLRTTGDDIAAPAKEIAALPALKAPEFERISRIDAALRHVTSFLPLAIGSVLLDCASALIVFWLLLVHLEREAASTVRSRAGHLTLGELLDAREALSSLNGKDTSQDVVDNILGKDGTSLPRSRKPRLQ